MADEFYIGWEAQAASGVGRFIRRALVALISIALLVAVVLAVSQRMIGEGAFEWGTVKMFAGTLRMKPYPHLLVPRPGGAEGQNQWSAYHLVAPWKFGLNPALTAAFDGQSVRLKGTLIYRGSQTMIEVVEGSIQSDNTSTAARLPEVLSLGRQVLTGEIVDSKCFFGVMNPGQLTPHRACAIRCISGGIPPVLLVRRDPAPPLYFILVAADGRPVNQAVLDFVAEPVEITGDVERQGDLLVLRADPATFRRVGR